MNHTYASSSLPIVMLLIVISIAIAFFALIIWGVNKFVSQKSHSEDSQYDAAYETNDEYSQHSQTAKGFSPASGFAMGCAAVFFFSVFLIVGAGLFWSLSAVSSGPVHRTYSVTRSHPMVSPSVPVVITSKPPKYLAPEFDAPAIPAPPMPLALTNQSNASNSSSHSHSKFTVTAKLNSPDVASEATATADEQPAAYPMPSSEFSRAKFGTLGIVIFVVVCLFFIAVVFRREGQSHSVRQKNPLVNFLLLGISVMVGLFLLSMIFYMRMSSQEMMVRSEKALAMEKKAIALAHSQKLGAASEDVLRKKSSSNIANDIAKERELKYWMKEAVKKESKTPYRNATNDLIVRSGEFTTPQEAKQDCVNQFEKRLRSQFQKTYPEAKPMFSKHFVQSYAKSNYEDYTTSAVRSLGDELEAKLYRNYRRLKVASDQKLVGNLYQVYKTKESENRSYYLGLGLITAMIVLGGTSFFLRRISTDAADSEEMIG